MQYTEHAQSTATQERNMKPVSEIKPCGYNILEYTQSYHKYIRTTV